MEIKARKYQDMKPCETSYDYKRLVIDRLQILFISTRWYNYSPINQPIYFQYGVQVICGQLLVNYTLNN